MQASRAPTKKIDVNMNKKISRVRGFERSSCDTSSELPDSWWILVTVIDLSGIPAKLVETCGQVAGTVVVISVNSQIFCGNQTSTVRWHINLEQIY
jgi:hypothetical protein